MNAEAPRVPRFPPGVRLHHDRAREQWVLLGPERVIELDPIAHAVLVLVDGKRDLSEIVAALVEQFDAEPTQVGDDVSELLGDLADKRLLRW